MQNKKNKKIYNPKDEEEVKIIEDEQNNPSITKNNNNNNNNIIFKYKISYIRICQIATIAFMIILIINEIISLIQLRISIKNSLISYQNKLSKNKNKDEDEDNDIFGSNLELDDNKSIDNTTQENNEELKRENAIQIGLDYLNICQNGLLINNRAFTITNNPKISVIVPLYNCQFSIKTTVRSIQNQKMTDIEIILVNDFSNDKTSDIIEEMKIEDPRIKIIYNKKNMGTFYSRNIGALQTKGKYILTIDNDDIFIDENLFDIIYKEAEKDNYDIISFKVFEYTSEKDIIDNSVTNKKNNLIVKQPELGIFPITKNGKLYPNDILIWGKLIKSDKYKKAVKALGKKRYSTYLIWVEDTCMFFVICNFAESYKFIEKYGIFHFVSGYTSSNFQSEEQKMFGEIFLLEIIFDFSNNIYKKYSVYKLLALRDYNFFDVSNSKIKAYLISVIKKIMNCKYINKSHKEEIKIRYNSLGIK